MSGNIPPIHLRIDAIDATVPAGTSIWDAARSVGIHIPALCHAPKLQPVGVCRMCVVDIGGRVLAASCVRACEEGMNVVTNSERVEKQRKLLTALLLDDHPTPCIKEQTTRDCELEALGRKYGWLRRGTTIVPAAQFAPDGGPRKRDLPPGLRPRDHSSKVIAVDHQACILCDRCVRACDDIQSNDVIGRTGKGYRTQIGFDLNVPMGASTCVSCGECAAACPTGALVHKPITLPLAPRADTTGVESVCPYCGVGCTTTYFVKGNTILWAEGRDSPGSAGRLCVKGRYGWDYSTHPQRLTRPLIRRPEFYPKGPLSAAGRADAWAEREVSYDEVLPAFREASWDEALDLIAARLKSIKETHGPRALAGFGSAKCSNEEAYLFQKLMRAVLGTNNVDHCTRLCHASSVAALMEGIGSGAVTDVFGHAKLADVILITGSNTTANHPVAATFFKEAVKNGTKLIVVDPRQPDIARFAEHYCQIHSGTDVAFYNALMHILIRDELINREFIRERTEDFELLRAAVADYSPERVAPICGIPAETLTAVARRIGNAKSMLIFWGMGISQHTHGTDNARCLIALCLLTGNIGRPGTGLHPLRGQNNVQGASDAGLIPLAYPDYQLVTEETVRRRFEQAWGVPLDPDRGLTVVEVTKAALDGSVRGLFVMGENPLLSDPNVNKVRKALANLEFLAVQDIFLTETAEYADVILPASSFFEKTGTYTNTDRRVQLGRQVLDPPGQARRDWEVLCDLSRRLGYPMSYRGPEDIFAEFASLTQSYLGLTYERLGKDGVLWPIVQPGDVETPVLFSEQFPTPSGRARFVPCRLEPAKELPDAEYPFVLNTGRVLEHWHTGTMTRRAQALDALQPGPFVEVHPADLARLGIADGSDVVLRSRRGSIRLPVRASENVIPGCVFTPFHFREAAANLLTTDELDPFGKIPEFKFCAVRLEKA